MFLASAAFCLLYTAFPPGHLLSNLLLWYYGREWVATVVPKSALEPTSCLLKDTRTSFTFTL